VHRVAVRQRSWWWVLEFSKIEKMNIMMDLMEYKNHQLKRISQSWATQWSILMIGNIFWTIYHRGE
jgi:hypothetical protein